MFDGNTSLFVLKLLITEDRTRLLRKWISIFDCNLLSSGWTQPLSVYPTVCSSHRRTPCNSFDSILLQILPPASVIQTRHRLMLCHWFILQLPSLIQACDCLYCTKRILKIQLGEVNMWCPIVMTPWPHRPHIWHSGWLFRQCPHSLSGEWRLCAQWQASCVSECLENGGAGKVGILHQCGKSPSAPLDL